MRTTTLLATLLATAMPIGAHELETTSYSVDMANHAELSDRVHNAEHRVEELEAMRRSGMASRREVRKMKRQLASLKRDCRRKGYEPDDGCGRASTYDVLVHRSRIATLAYATANYAWRCEGGDFAVREAARERMLAAEQSCHKEAVKGWHSMSRCYTRSRQKVDLGGLVLVLSAVNGVHAIRSTDRALARGDLPEFVERWSIERDALRNHRRTEEIWREHQRKKMREQRSRPNGC